MDYTTTGLVASIKVRGMLPSSQLTFQTSDLITLANEEMQSGIVPLVLKFRSEYFVTNIDVPILSGVDKYEIPTRSIGGKIRNVSLIDNMGNEYDLPQIQKEETRFYNPSNAGTAPNNFVFFFEGNNIVVLPSESLTTDAIMSIGIFQRPSGLVATTAAAQISAINFGTNTVTVNSVPITMQTGVLCDFVENSPNFSNPQIDSPITGVAGTAITFGSLPDSLKINDWVCLAQESPIAQIPLELHPMLAQRTVVKIMEAQGDQQGLQNAQSKLKEMEDAAQHILSPRSDGNPKKLINRYSPLRSWGSRRFTNY